MRNLLVTICYDGKNYHGWQIQKNALSIQEVFQNALKKVVHETPEIKGCSRTDTGVHANMYGISLKTKSKISCRNLIGALNRYLPPSVAVTDCCEMPMDFHARYSCLGKEYIYKIWNHKIRNPFLNGYALHYYHPLNAEKLDKAAKSFVGKHDFTSFCTLDKRNPENLVRNVKNFDVYRNGDIVEIKVHANGFLYNMVRIMVGTLLRIAQGKIDEANIPEIIAAKNRKEAGPTAPAHGLYLNRIYY